MMKTKVLGTINEEGEYQVVPDADEFVLETIDENGNIILNYIDDKEDE